MRLAVYVWILASEKEICNNRFIIEEVDVITSYEMVVRDSKANCFEIQSWTWTTSVPQECQPECRTQTWTRNREIMRVATLVLINKKRKRAPTWIDVVMSPIYRTRGLECNQNGGVTNVRLLLHSVHTSHGYVKSTPNEYMIETYEWGLNM